MNGLSRCISVIAFAGKLTRCLTVMSKILVCIFSTLLAFYLVAGLLSVKKCLCDK